VERVLTYTALRLVDEAAGEVEEVACVKVSNTLATH